MAKKKIHVVVVSENPLVLHLNKKGRAPGIAVAKDFLRRNYPDVIDWTLDHTDHSVLATEITKEEK